MGNVPNEKVNIINAPCRKFPEITAFSCIACVKPHGRKNVPIPKSIGVKNFVNTFPPNRPFERLLGRANSSFLNHGDIFKRFNPSINITKKRRIPIINSMVCERMKRDPNIPNTPPSRKKPKTLDI